MKFSTATVAAFAALLSVSTASIIPDFLVSPLSFSSSSSIVKRENSLQAPSSSYFVRLLARHGDDDDDDDDDDDNDNDNDVNSDSKKHMDGSMMESTTTTTITTTTSSDSIPNQPPANNNNMAESMDMPTNNEDSSHKDTHMEPSPASMHGGHHHNNWKNILEDPSLEPQQRAYWQLYNTTTFFNADAPNKFFLYSHIFLVISAWAVLYPISVLLSTIPTTSLYLPVQTLQVATFFGSLFCLAIFGATCPPDLYPNNSYSKMSIALLFISLIHWVAAVIKSLANWAVSSRYTPMDGAEYLLANLNPSSNRGQFIRPSLDSGHGDSGSSASSGDDESISSEHKPNHHNEDDDDLDDLSLFGHESSASTAAASSSNAAQFPSRDAEAFETPAPNQNRLISRIMANKHVYQVVDKFGSVARIVYMIINRPLFVVGYGYLVLGTATVFRLGLGSKVFNILAHLIKGSVFFLYGILTLCRYLGAFADKGFAWNIAPGSIHDPAHTIKKKKSMQMQARLDESKTSGILSSIVNFFPNLFKDCTMEFIESFLIFFYGSTNVFMEHLGNTDGHWSHKDLQHASIAFMYLGGGICGLIMESRWIRRLVNRLISTSNNDCEDDENSGLIGHVSINPIPTFIIFWTGVLMSQHEQAFPLSTLIHMQWGYLLTVGSLFRFGTYILLYLNPPKSTVPSRPITEVIASFTLLCGGLIFMESNGETVDALAYNLLDGMFVLNVNVGVTALIMSWIMLVWAFKSWVASRQRVRFQGLSV
ncbi:uncharacterized protein SAPINGB_P000103 [Magnusiomyces paraingens]|uniref:Protein YTP1-like C-terminal domain-containing protein n=1 Tax=Magnusiomyces paraingens TaxID=2606893 RepID=A0A5E8AYE6_9ASCO|nr:uncharacterized protein SAPINGB_P000103 [Saprochaete ingens]VVT43694.1 unnamed protein product [Saprochaete ingens]